MHPTDSSTPQTNLPDATQGKSEFRPEDHIQIVSSLLQNLDATPVASAKTTPDAALVQQENRLAQARLGVASGLLAALRAKDPSSASHCLQVALTCSAWSLILGMDDDERDQLEIAALLHDIGKIGVPEHVLLKPGKLSREETAIMEQRHQFGLDILGGCCLSEEIVNIVRFAPAWYDGSLLGAEHAGSHLPRGARMIAIADAFTSMTTDHVWRRAMSRERATTELFEYSGSQFDPELVYHFCALQSQDQDLLYKRVADRWLHQLDPEAVNVTWGPQATSRSAGPADAMAPFYAQLVEQMHDAVLFVDTDAQIGLWNHAAEQLTGIPASGLLDRRWSCNLVKMQNEHGWPIDEADCPMRQAMQAGMPQLRRLTITGHGYREIRVNAHAIPVVRPDGTQMGAVLQLRDVSPETDLAKRVQSLHEKATHDPLTKVANRAAFDQSLERLVKSHAARQQPCSLILCDLDHFKKTNDTYGHQAGDDVLISFASLLKRKCRPGDLVARYGGEEFVMLCADCDNAAATRRAEDIRRELAALPHRALGGGCVTASFGVTELQAGDTPETLLRRSDRTLYQAKDRGRNMVVQLGTGYRETADPPARTWWNTLFGGPARVLLRSQLITAVPMKLAIEKLRGFISDHHADVVSISDDRVILKIDASQLSLNRRATDRRVAYIIELVLSEKRSDTKTSTGRHQGTLLRTLLHVTIRPKRDRDRRRRDVNRRAQDLLMSVKAYLMAQDLHENEADDPPHTANPEQETIEAT